MFLVDKVSKHISKVIKAIESIMATLLFLLNQHLLVELEAPLVLLLGIHLIEDVIDAVEETVSDLSFHSSIIIILCNK